MITGATLPIIRLIPTKKFHWFSYVGVTRRFTSLELALCLLPSSQAARIAKQIGGWGVEIAWKNMGPLECLGLFYLNDAKKNITARSPGCFAAPCLMTSCLLSETQVLCFYMLGSSEGTFGCYRTPLRRRDVLSLRSKRRCAHLGPRSEHICKTGGDFVFKTKLKNFRILWS